MHKRLTFIKTAAASSLLLAAAIGWQMQFAEGSVWDGIAMAAILAVALAALFKTVQLIEWKNLPKTGKTDVILSFLFFALLLIPALRIDDEKISVEENRTLAVYHHLWEKGSLNRDYGRQFEAWFNDRFNGRHFLINFFNKLKGRINSATAKGNDRVLAGKDGWLFLRREKSVDNFQNMTLFSESELEQVTAYLSAIDEWCRKNGKSFYMLIAPDKNKLYGEYFQNIRKIRPDSESRANQLVNYLRANSKVKVVYALNTLMKHKKDGLLYWKLDTHWNEEGAYWGYRDLADLSEGKLVAVEVNKWTGYSRERGDDLTDLYPEVDNVDMTVYHKPADLPPYKCNSPHEREDRFCKSGNGHLSAVIYRDSFSNSLYPYLAATFKKSSFYWRFDVKKDEIKEADVVIIEIVERSLPRLNKFNFED